MFKILMGLMLSCVCSVGSAAMIWVNNLTIDSYKLYYDGVSVIFTVYVKEPISTGCAFSDTNKAFSYWTPSNTNPFHAVLQAAVIAADAQGRKVNLQYDNTQCSAVAGRMLYGVYSLPLPE